MITPNSLIIFKASGKKKALYHARFDHKTPIAFLSLAVVALYQEIKIWLSFQNNVWRCEIDAVGHGRTGGVWRHHQGLLPRRAGLRDRLLHHGPVLLRRRQEVEEEGGGRVRTRPHGLGPEQDWLVARGSGFAVSKNISVNQDRKSRFTILNGKKLFPLWLLSFYSLEFWRRRRFSESDISFSPFLWRFVRRSAINQVWK